MYRQYRLETKPEGAERVCWLDNISLRVGQRVTLKKDPTGWEWIVKEVYTAVEEQPQWRSWKVGGLR